MFYFQYDGTFDDYLEMFIQAMAQPKSFNKKFDNLNEKKTYFI